MSTPHVAIDFGTTRTKLAYWNDVLGRPDLIEIGRYWPRFVPSLVYVPRGRSAACLVGDDAQDQLPSDPAGVIVGLKREIHRPGKKRLGADRPQLDRIELAGQLFFHVRRQCELQVFHAPLTSCTLTVPVAFPPQKRECLLRAAQWGGFCDVRLIEEPVAAAQAWAHECGEKLGRYLVVCDLGGGTTDFALLQACEGRFEPVADVPTVGIELGGNDVDEALLAAMLDCHPDRYEELYLQRSACLMKLKDLRESASRHVDGPLRIALADDQLTVDVAVMNRCTKDLVERVGEELRRFLAICHAHIEDDALPVLLVGGGARMRGLAETVESLTHAGGVFHWHRADVATVLGAVEGALPQRNGSCFYRPEVAAPEPPDTFCEAEPTHVESFGCLTNEPRPVIELTQWYVCGPDLVQFGPLTKDELDRFALTADCQVYCEGNDAWQWAGDLYPHLLRDHGPRGGASEALGHDNMGAQRAGDSHQQEEQAQWDQIRQDAALRRRPLKSLSDIDDLAMGVGVLVAAIIGLPIAGILLSESWTLKSVMQSLVFAGGVYWAAYKAARWLLLH